MKGRENIAQVASIARSKSRLIEGMVTKVWPQTRVALVRLDGSSQIVQINLGAIDPSLVSPANSRVLLYDSGNALYAISVIPGQHAKSSPGITLGDTSGATKLSVYNSQNTEVANINSSGDICYNGDLKPTRSSTEYTGYSLVPLSTPIAHNSFNGDSYSDVTSNTKIENTSWATTIPSDAKALLIYGWCRDSGSAATAGLYVALFSSSGASNASFAISPSGKANDDYAFGMGVVPCTDGDIWYQVEASGTSTMDIWLLVWGYFI